MQYIVVLTLAVDGGLATFQGASVQSLSTIKATQATGMK